ncbi:MAG: hypothetical protein ACC651_10610 [Candidatus Scalindua sp.]
MVSFTDYPYPATTTKQKFKICPDPSSSTDIKKRKIFSDKAAQSSRIEHVYGIGNYGRVLKFVKQETIQTTIDTLINFNYELKTPIKVKIIKDTNGIVGDIEELELYSFGDSEFEVLRELNEEVVSLFEDLIKMEDKNLGKYPKKWKSILNQYVKRIR